MEGFQRKINIMKHKINNIQANIELIQAQTPKEINSYRKENITVFNSPMRDGGNKKKYNFDYKKGSSLLQYKNNVNIIKSKINTNTSTITIKKRQNRTIDQNELDSLRRNFLQKQNKNYDYNKIIKEIVDITNTVYPNSSITLSTITEKYKSILKENKLKNEMITKLISLYNQDNKTNLSTKENKYLVHIYKWLHAKTFPSSNQNKYQQYCESIMKEYKLKSIHELSIFFDNLLKKTNQNDTFIEGIAKILLKDAKPPQSS